MALYVHSSSAAARVGHACRMGITTFGSSLQETLLVPTINTIMCLHGLNPVQSQPSKLAQAQQANSASPQCHTSGLRMSSTRPLLIPVHRFYTIHCATPQCQAPNTAAALSSPRPACTDLTQVTHTHAHVCQVHHSHTFTHTSHVYSRSPSSGNPPFPTWWPAAAAAAAAALMAASAASDAARAAWAAAA